MRVPASLPWDGFGARGDRAKGLRLRFASFSSEARNRSAAAFSFFLRRVEFLSVGVQLAREVDRLGGERLQLDLGGEDVLVETRERHAAFVELGLELGRLRARHGARSPARRGRFPWKRDPARSFELLGGGPGRLELRPEVAEVLRAGVDLLAHHAVAGARRRASARFRSSCSSLYLDRLEPLGLEGRQVALDLGQEGVDLAEVGLELSALPVGPLELLVVLRDPREALHEAAARHRAHADDAVDVPLLDEIVPVPGESRMGEEGVHLRLGRPPSVDVEVRVVSVRVARSELDVSGELHVVGFDGISRSLLSKTRETSHSVAGFFDEPPLKKRCVKRSARSAFELVGPRTNRIASEMFDLPIPLGPATPVNPGWKGISVAPAKDLKLRTLRRFRYIGGVSSLSRMPAPTALFVRQMSAEFDHPVSHI